MILRVPPRVRVGFIIFWFGWKIVVAILFLFIVASRKSERQSGPERSALVAFTATSPKSPTKVLYIITTLAEFNNGLRATERGQDRLAEILIPIMVDSVESMIGFPFHYDVDVFLICGYELKPEREQFIRAALPNGVGFQVWSDATPLGYDKHLDSTGKLVLNTRTLARQHRYVIKDKFFYYDHFMAFEDDMRITGHHVEHFLKLSSQLEKLRQSAPTSLPDVPENLDDPKQAKFFGQMTRAQMDRLIPGLIRVEVLLNETLHGAQKELAPIPIDFDVDGEERHVDPSICCHVNMNPNKETPKKPQARDLVIWETNIRAFSLRQLPISGSSQFDWMVLMLGPGKRVEKSVLLGGYWSGRDGDFGDEKKPSGGHPELIAQQGGWMATRDQIARMNKGLCMGSFLPPFDQPEYYSDGQESMNVEYWSGSYQFFTGVKGGCNMQRVISLQPEHFSKHLIYHVANNKQRQLAQSRMLRADDLFGQLNTVRKRAIEAKEATEERKLRR